MSTPHVVVMPSPGQGHIIPLLEFSQCLARHGIRVTFVNSEYNHKRILKSLEGKKYYVEEKIHLVSIPDGVEHQENRKIDLKSVQKVNQVMAERLEELIQQINGVEGEKIACVITDMWVAIELAEKMKIKRAVVWPASAATLALIFSIPKLIDDGIINEDGTLIKKQTIKLTPNMPAINSTDFFWVRCGDLATQKIIFEIALNNRRVFKNAERLICNSTCDLEPAEFAEVPQLLPIGPLLASNRLGKSAGYFWPEDSSCLEWLDQQQPNSVIYIAFGSTTTIDKIQFKELALGLELCNRPFLWVVRPDVIDNPGDAFPEGLQDRVAVRGKLVSWVPQQKVLSHPSIACFLSHCGWNSTLEGVSNGIPFLCWPYFADQLLNESYICDVWKVGLKFNRDESSIITRDEIKTKLDQVLGDEKFKQRALELKEKAMNSVREGGFSDETFRNFIRWIKTSAGAQDNGVSLTNV